MLAATDTKKLVRILNAITSLCCQSEKGSKVSISQLSAKSNVILHEPERSTV